MEYGVYPSEIKPDSPAEQAGLQRGEILTGLNGESFNHGFPFINQLFQFEPGDVATFHVKRGTSEFDVEIVLGEEA